jgi:hypothetical protein
MSVVFLCFILCSSGSLRNIFKGEHFISFISESWHVAANVQERIVWLFLFLTVPGSPAQRQMGAKERRSAFHNGDQQKPRFNFNYISGTRGQFKNQPWPSPAAQLNSILEPAEPAMYPRLCDLLN